MMLMVKTKTKPKINRTKVAAATRPTAKAAPTAAETDGVYILKLVLYLIMGSVWIRITKGNLTFPIPIGLAVGVLFARMERFQIDRKIEYAVLLISMFIGFWLPLGIEFVL